MAGPQYSIASPRGVCAVTGEPIRPGERCVSMLVENTDDDTLDRIDLSIAAWDAGRGPDRAPLAIWHTVMPEKDKPRRVLIGDDEVIDLFEQLGETDDPKQQAFRYLLALILIRKRRLIWERAVPKTGDAPGLLLVRRRGEKEAPPIEVVDPGLDDEAIESATEQIAAVMNLDGRDA